MNLLPPLSTFPVLVNAVCRFELLLRELRVYVGGLRIVGNMRSYLLCFVGMGTEGIERSFSAAQNEERHVPRQTEWFMGYSYYYCECLTLSWPVLTHLTDHAPVTMQVFARAYCAI